MNGGNIIVKMDGVAIAATKVNKINTQCDPIEVSSPTQGKWKDYEDGRIGWSINTDFLIIAEKYIDQLGACLNVGQKYTLTVCDNMLSGTVRLQGKAMLRVCDIQLVKGSLAYGAFQFVGCGELEEPQHLVTGITLSPNSLSLLAGTSTQIAATVSPADATDTRLQWSSSDTSVATVNQSGVVTAVEEGTCVITSSALDGSGILSTCACNVIQEVINVSSITLSQSSGTLVVGRTLQLSASVLPSNATNKQVNWSSSNPSVASVAQDGTVTAIAAGNCVITCSATDGSGVSETCSISVQESATTNVTKYGNGLSYYYFDDNLEVLESSSVKMTDYIPVNEGDIITYTGWNYDSVRMVGYTDNHGSNPTALLTGTRLSVVTAQDVIIPANVSYIRAVGQDWAQQSAIPPRPALEVLKTVE